MKFLDPEATVDYVCEDDRKLPKDEQVIFKLTTLTINEEALISNTYGMRDEGEVSINLGDQTVLAMHLGLADIEGAPFELSRDEKTKYFPGTRKRKWRTKELDRIAPKYRQEVAREIMRMCNLNEEEEKN